MLSELVIRDLALIEHVELSLGPGLNVITGETGAGKSLLVGALELLLGTRPKPGLVRQGASKCTVEGRFVVAGGSAGASIARWARKYGPELLDEWRASGPDEERELILGRSVGNDGKTRAYVNGRPVTREALADLAPRLFEIHGQNEHQRLHDPSEQLRLLDGFGKLENQVGAYRIAREAWQRLVDEALRLEREASERRDRLDLVRFQLSELQGAAPDPEEKTRLAPERELLRHAASVKQGLAEALEGLADADQAALDRVQRAQRFVDGWKAQIAALEGAGTDLDAARVHLEDAVRALRSLGDRLEIDPRRLEQVEERLAELERLERKYKTDAQGLISRRAELEAELARLERDESSQEGLAERVAQARALVLERGGELRRARKALRDKLVPRVAKALKDLGLENARFDVKLGQRGEEDGISAADAADRVALEADAQRFGERGMDRIEFLLAANPGELLQKLRAVASGGETARIMLALRSVLADAGEARTLLFDEIDSGVGGRLGPAVGAHLRKLGLHHQVLCVTHLPAIAALAARHLKVQKSVEGGRTRTEVGELRGEARVLEIADMIAGGAQQETAKAEARRLLGPNV
ncbi:MAG: DNA repair protein RecN [Planctomycetes bacterium]|nr:DNA repair protein RecN [Planctomycetota bacterium]